MASTRAWLLLALQLLVGWRRGSSHYSVDVALELLQLSVEVGGEGARLGLAALRSADGCVAGYDRSTHGVADCDGAWSAYRVNCSVLVYTYGWNCGCCHCPGDRPAPEAPDGLLRSTRRLSAETVRRLDSRCDSPLQAPRVEVSGSARAAPKGCREHLDVAKHGAADCDNAWEVYGVNCSHLTALYGWNCGGCQCPGDSRVVTGVDGKPMIVDDRSSRQKSDTSCQVSVDADRFGVADCDSAWYRYRMNCDDLVRVYGWDCSGCSCPGDAAPVSVENATPAPVASASSRTVDTVAPPPGTNMSSRRSCFTRLDSSQHGVIDCDNAWEVYRSSCAELTQSFGWDCQGCHCPGDPDFDPRRMAEAPMTAPSPGPTTAPTAAPTAYPTASPSLEPSPEVTPSPTPASGTYIVEATLSFAASASRDKIEATALRVFAEVFNISERVVTVDVSLAGARARQQGFRRATQTYNIRWTVAGSLEEIEPVSEKAEAMAADPPNSDVAVALKLALSTGDDVFQQASVTATRPTLTLVTPSPTPTPTQTATDVDAEAPTAAPAQPPPPPPPSDPTPAPSRAHSGGVNATGDPHMMNLRGQRFDLMQPGKHVLIQIPRAPGTKKTKLQRATLLQVEVEAQKLGAACSEMYIQHVNVTGKWANERMSGQGSASTGGFQYDVKDSGGKAGTNWEKFGGVELKVVWGRTKPTTDSLRIAYLNLYVRHLGQVGYVIGGLLGEDDHTAAATPDAKCSRVLELSSSGVGDARAVHEASVAEALLA